MRRFKLMWRTVVAGILAGQVGILFGCLTAPYSRALIPEVAAATVSGACPGENFSAFIEAFAESAAIQRRYTHVPLEYGYLDARLIGTTKEDKAFSRRTINSFEAIPSFDRKDGGRIFPSKKQRTEEGLEVRVGAGSERSGSGVVATIGLPDAGLSVQYRFVRSGNCWNLIGIDDRST